MKEKDLRRLSRKDLVDIIYRLQKENEELHRQIEDRTIRIGEAGSIAEAALAVNRVMEAAQAAAEDYLHSIYETVGERNGQVYRERTVYPVNTLREDTSDEERNIV